jgi:hypothetical protein
MISGDFIGGQTENQKFSIVNIGQVAKVLSCVKIIPFQASSVPFLEFRIFCTGTRNMCHKAQDSQIAMARVEW